ncbi:hypothetical protein LJC48_04045, partial [Desulfovibrio sp. OttesenSCG-928-C06]|nr:hypothetical protein [Desulfovibrio sp. OttesenSCG-928-C06]
MPESNQNRNAAIIDVNKPAAGAVNTIDSQAGADIRFNFDPTQDADISRPDGSNDLRFVYDDGSEVVLSDFFAVGDESLPMLVLPDGTTVDVNVAFAGMDIDLSPAAGPGAGAGAGSGGVGDYSGDPGAFTDGVDRLGMTDPFFWGRGDEGEERPTLMRADPFIIIEPRLPEDTDPELGYTITASGASFTMNEAYLNPDVGNKGTQAGKGTLNCTVEFVIYTNDGVGTIVIEGVEYQVVGGNIVGFPADGITDADGVGSGVLSNPVLTLQPDGSYLLTFEYTLTGNHNHAAGQGANIASDLDNFTISATSVNGAVSNEVTTSVNLIDDIPEYATGQFEDVEGSYSYLANGAESDTIVVNEAGLVEFGNHGPVAVEGSVVDNVNWGADGFGKITQITFDGEVYEVNAAGFIVVEGSGWTFSMDAATGSYTFTLTGAQNHPGGADDTTQDGRNSIDVPSFEIIGMDGDGDPISIGVDVSIQDDVPQVFFKKDFTDVDETKLDKGALVTTAIVTIAWGADGPAAENALQFDMDALTDVIAGFTKGGEALSIDPASKPNHVIVWDASGKPVFEISINENGLVTYKQHQSFDHSVPGDHNEPADIPLTIIATDSDGDTTTADLTVTVQDDGPAIEFGVSGPNGAQADDVVSDMVFIGRDFVYNEDGNSNFTLDGGADGIKSVVLTDAVGMKITGVLENGIWTFTNGDGNTIMTIGADGKITISLPEGAASGDYAWTVTVTDKDGDTASDTIKFEAEEPFNPDFKGGLNVDESWLAGGTMNADGSLAADTVREHTSDSGSIELTDYQYENLEITVGGKTYDVSDMFKASDGYPVTVSVEDGSALVLTWKDGNLSYSYEVRSSQQHSDNEYSQGNEYQGAKEGSDLDPNHWDESNDIKFEFKVGDQTAELVVKVEDDGLLNYTQTPGEAGFEYVPAAYNIAICLDLSGSMLYKANSSIEGKNAKYSPEEFYNYYLKNDGDDSTNPTHGGNAQYGYEDTRMFQTQVATLEMLLAYRAQVADADGNVKDGALQVTLFGFSIGGYKFNKGEPMDIDTAIKMVEEMFSPIKVTIGADGKPVVSYDVDNIRGGWDLKDSDNFPSALDGTNWANGLKASEKSIEDFIKEGAANGDETRFYFMSDGEPNNGDTNVAAWKAFLTKLAGMDGYEHFELHSVGLSGVNSNYFSNITKDSNGKPVGEQHMIPDDANLESFISELLGTLSDYTGYIKLPSAADGVVKQAYADEDAAKADPTAAQEKAFLREVELTITDSDGKEVIVKGVIGGELDANGFPSESIQGGNFCTIQTEYGTFTFRADGTYHFKANPEYNKLPDDVKFEFELTFMDSDGDTVKGGFDFTLKAPELPLIAPNATATVAESDIAGLVDVDGNVIYKAGTDAAHGKDNVTGNDNANEAHYEGSFGTVRGEFAWDMPKGNVEAFVDGEYQNVVWVYGGANGDDKSILIGYVDGHKDQPVIEIVYNSNGTYSV